MFSIMSKLQRGSSRIVGLSCCYKKAFVRKLQSVVPIQYRQLNMLPTSNCVKKDWKFFEKDDAIAGFNSCHSQSSAFLPFALALCASLAYSFCTQKDEIKKTGYDYSLLLKVKQLFVVNAAKPIAPDDGGKLNPPPIKGIGLRERFNFIADVVEAVQKSVVCIEIKDHSTVNWFGIPQRSGNGSGFIVKEDGLILTNAHVVTTNNQSSITVKLHDGRCFAGYVEEVDYESDLATVRIKARGLPTLQLGNSSETRIGEIVVAMGSPLNLSNTVTSGIVSSTRGASEIGIQANDINYIQTDAAITFGNSGGPLINLDGEAIGINSMKVMPGISFAIPIDHAKKFLERIEFRRAAGKIRDSKRYVGLTLLTLTEPIRTELQSKYSMKNLGEGVVVWQVVVGSPAFLAGIKPGDVITEINGSRMLSSKQVHDKIKTDDQLILNITRGHKSFQITVAPENVNR